MNWLPSTVSIPELLWTIGTTLATYYIFRLYRRSMLNLKYLREAKLNFAREDQGEITAWVFGTLLALEGMNALIGWTALFVPAPKVPEVHTFSYVVTVIFLLEAFFVAGASYMIDYKQRSLISKIEHLESKANGEGDYGDETG